MKTNPVGASRHVAMPHTQSFSLLHDCVTLITSVTQSTKFLQLALSCQTPLRNQLYTVPIRIKFKAQSTNAFFCFRQSTVRWLLPASDYCRALNFRIHPPCGLNLNCAQRFELITTRSEAERSGRTFGR